MRQPQATWMIFIYLSLHWCVTLIWRWTRRGATLSWSGGCGRPVSCRERSGTYSTPRTPTRSGTCSTRYTSHATSVLVDPQLFFLDPAFYLCSRPSGSEILFLQTFLKLKKIRSFLAKVISFKFLVLLLYNVLGLFSIIYTQCIAGQVQISLSKRQLNRFFKDLGIFPGSGSRLRTKWEK